MDKAIRQNIDRRALLKGASIATMAAAIPAAAAAAIGTPSAAPAAAADTIFALIAERDRLRVLARAAEIGEEEREEIWSRVDDLTAEITATPTVTLAGAMAQLGEAVRQINVDHSDNDGNVDTEAFELQDRAVLNAHAALVRLLPGSAVQS